MNKIDLGMFEGRAAGWIFWDIEDVIRILYYFVGFLGNFLKGFLDMFLD